MSKTNPRTILPAIGGHNIQIWTDPEGDIRLYGPRESNIAQGQRPRAILLSRGPYNLICSRDQSIFVLLYDH